MIKRHTVEIIEELDKDGKVVSRTTTTTDETDDNHYGSYYPPITDWELWKDKDSNLFCCEECAISYNGIREIDDLF